MPEREIDIDLTNSTATHLGHVPTPSEVAEYKARMAGVFDRGLVIDRLHVELPDHIHGEWVARDPQFVKRMEIYGYSIDTEFAPKKSANDHGDGTANLGDVVFMTIPKWKKEIIDQVARDKYRDTHLRNRRKQKEESDFEANNRGLGMPLTSGKGDLVASSLQEVDGVEIERTLTPKG